MHDMLVVVDSLQTRFVGYLQFSMIGVMHQCRSTKDPYRLIQADLKSTGDNGREISPL